MSIEEWFERQYRSTCDGLRAEWDGVTRHGNWCGAGNIGQDDVDGQDSCCHRHDDAYGSAGISADDMWTINGFVAGRQADLDLIACSQSSDSTDPSYTQRLIAMFSSRVAIADAILRMQALYDRLRNLLSSNESMSQDEVQQYAAWLEEVGVSGDEVAYAAHATGVAVGGDGSAWA